MRFNLHALAPPLIAIVAGLALHPLTGGQPAPDHQPVPPVEQHSPYVPPVEHAAPPPSQPPPSGPHFFCDSAQPNLCPAHSGAVAAYLNGYGGYGTARQDFPHAFIIAIDARGGDPYFHGPEALDIEPGAAWPISLVHHWAVERNREGHPAVLYCALSWENAVREAAAGTDYVIWISVPAAGHPITMPGSGAVQYFWADGGQTYDENYTPYGVYHVFGR